MKKTIIGIIAGVLVGTISSVLASTLIASQIVYIPKDSTWKVDSVGAAIDSLQSSIRVPAGTIMPYASTTVPDGYLECNGQEVSRETYASLFAVIGTTYGSGNGSTTFNVPDLRGEFLRGTGTNSHANQGSGENVGTHQDATSIPFFYSNTRYIYTYKTGGVTEPLEMDTTLGGSSSISGYTFSANEGSKTFSSYTTRPTNTSVLYLIKY